MDLDKVTIIFETHSLSEDNELGFATGWLDGKLSEKGKQLAHELGARRANGIDAVFTSDLKRAAETASIAFGNSGIPIFEDARLRECNYGDLDGYPVEQIHARRAKHIDEPFPNGQSYCQVVEQMRDFLEYLASGWSGKRVLIIGHTATRWSLDHLLNKADLHELVEAPFDWKEGWNYMLLIK